jgi:hypothetical protein
MRLKLAWWIAIVAAATDALLNSSAMHGQYFLDGPGEVEENATQALSLPPRVTTNSCGTTAGEPAGWISATMSAPAVSDYTSATFTMLDSDGAPITGWTELPLTGDRRIDLSSLPVSTTGDRPTVQVAYTGLSPAAVASQFSFEVAESAFTLCVSYMKACPAGPGVFTNIPGSTSTVEVSASATPSGGSTSTYNESASVVAPSLMVLSHTTDTLPMLR